MNSEDIIAKEIEEKKLVREFFKNKRNGFFIEVGANEPHPTHSQTMHLESELNWSGLLIEPIDYLADQLRKKRPNCEVIECACTQSKKLGETELIIPISRDGDLTGHASLEVNIDHSMVNKTRILRVTTKTLEEVINEHAPNTKIDFLSIDVEGTELDVLKGANLETYNPELIIIEDRLVFLGKHLFLRKEGYKLFRRTSFNNWFTKKIPVGSSSFANQLNLFRKVYLSSWIKRIRESFRMKTFRTFAQI
jgi:FkbM family methyltransferase